MGGRKRHKKKIDRASKAIGPCGCDECSNGVNTTLSVIFDTGDAEGDTRLCNELDFFLPSTLEVSNGLVLQTILDVYMCRDEPLSVAETTAMVELSICRAKEAFPPASPKLRTVTMPGVMGSILHLPPLVCLLVQLRHQCISAALRPKGSGTLSRSSTEMVAAIVVASACAHSIASGGSAGAAIGESKESILLRMWVSGMEEQRPHWATSSTALTATVKFISHPTNRPLVEWAVAEVCESVGHTLSTMATSGGRLLTCSTDRHGAAIVICQVLECILGGRVTDMDMHWAIPVARCLRDDLFIFKTLLLPPCGEPECLICMEQVPEAARRLVCPECAETFHADCILTWFKRQRRCPHCSADFQRVRLGADPPPLHVKFDEHDMFECTGSP